MTSFRCFPTALITLPGPLDGQEAWSEHRVDHLLQHWNCAAGSALSGILRGDSEAAVSVVWVLHDVPSADCSTIITTALGALGFGSRHARESDLIDECCAGR